MSRGQPTRRGRLRLLNDRGGALPRALRGVRLAHAPVGGILRRQLGTDGEHGRAGRAVFAQPDEPARFEYAQASDCRLAVHVEQLFQLFSGRCELAGRIECAGKAERDLAGM